MNRVTDSLFGTGIPSECNLKYAPHIEVHWYPPGAPVGTTCFCGKKTRQDEEAARVWRHGAPDNPGRPDPMTEHVTVRGASGRTWTQYGYEYRAKPESKTSYAFWMLLQRFGPLTEITNEPHSNKEDEDDV